MKRRNGKPRFNPRDTSMRESIGYIGDLPYQHRATITTALYVWNERHPTRWMDKRDLPGLVKAAGIDCLSGDWVDGYKEHKEKRAALKAAKKSEGVADGDK